MPDALTGPLALVFGLPESDIVRLFAWFPLPYMLAFTPLFGAKEAVFAPSCLTISLPSVMMLLHTCGSPRTALFGGFVAGMFGF
jgi:hypothetical protein